MRPAPRRAQPTPRRAPPAPPSPARPRASTPRTPGRRRRRSWPGAWGGEAPRASGLCGPRRRRAPGPGRGPGRCPPRRCGPRRRPPRPTPDVAARRPRWAYLGRQDDGSPRTAAGRLATGPPPPCGQATTSVRPGFTASAAPKPAPSGRRPSPARVHADRVPTSPGAGCARSRSRQLKRGSRYGPAGSTEVVGPPAEALAKLTT